ncbi:MAG: hypothetical protein Alpg2KO_13070 [Alphaproteobacteria bacterium]
MVVVFSAINIPRGRYGFTNFFRDCGRNVLYINSPGNQWFQPEIDDISPLIDQAIDLTQSQNVFYYGASMGAYGALLYAMLRKDGPCFSFGPNTTLGIPGSHSSRYDITFDGRYNDLSKLSYDGDFPLHVVFGAFDLVDAVGYFDLNQLTGLDCQLYDSCHSIHQHLFNSGDVIRMRDQFFNGSKVDAPASALYKHDPQTDTERTKRKNYQIWSDHLTQNAVDLDIDILDPGDMLMQSRILHVRRDFEAASNLLGQAINIIENDAWLKQLPSGYIGRYHFAHAQSLKRNRDPEASIAAFLKAQDYGHKPDACQRNIDQIRS